MECEKCSQPINSTDLYTICEGRCAKRFHCLCVSVTEDQMSAFTRNIIWMCDACTDDFYKYRECLETKQSSGADVTLKDEISELKSKVADITKTLALIVPMENSSPRMAPRHSTPISLATLYDGSNAEYERSHIERSSDDQSLHSSTSSTFSLFMTNIDCQVTEEEIGRMVSQCLGIPPAGKLYVRKLVPKGRNCSVLEYVSFKVVISEHLSDIAKES